MKSRRYGDRGPEAAGSTNAALLVSLGTLLRLLAPYLPFATEEVWSWWQEGSIHRARWPTADEVLAHIGEPDARGEQVLERAVDVIGAIRRRKSEEQKPLKTPVARLLVKGPAADLALVESVRADSVAVGLVQHFEAMEADDFEAIVELGVVEAPVTGEPRP